jgi:ADP-ribosylglycohydrolase
LIHKLPTRFYNTESFKGGCLDVVNLGDDADTTAAVYGQIAGAYYGVDDIPASWRSKLALRDLMEKMCTQLYQLSLTQDSGGGGSAVTAESQV